MTDLLGQELVTEPHIVVRHCHGFLLDAAVTAEPARQLILAAQDELRRL